MKAVFSHSKNRLYRLLTFPAEKTYTAVGLKFASRTEDEALMERAFECLYKIKVGTRNVHHKTSPHIDFDILPTGTDWAVLEDIPGAEAGDDFYDDSESEENYSVDGSDDRPHSELEPDDEFDVLDEVDFKLWRCGHVASLLGKHELIWRALFSALDQGWWFSKSGHCTLDSKAK